MGRIKGARNKDLSKGSSLRFDASIYRLVISNIQGYGTFKSQLIQTKRASNICPQLDALKSKVLDYLLQHQNRRTVKPKFWSIAWEIHSTSGLPHLDILIVFEKNVIVRSTSFNYLIKDLKIDQIHVDSQRPLGHVWVTPYSPTKLNKAILDYGFKEDPSVVSNFTQQTKQQLVRVNKLKLDAYRYLELQMLKDPLHFNLEQYCRKNDLYQYVTGWSSIKNKLKDSQAAAANLALKSKPGFKYIDRAHIQSTLSSSQLKLYDSWPGYQTIVDFLNQTLTYGYKRPLKSMNLLITGPASIGKTSLFQNDLNDTYNCVERYLSVYPMGTKTWWPNYKPQVYKLIFWNEAKLTSYSYDTILKVLQGSKVDLPFKGGSVLKYDNPLVIMTSNLTLEQMIQQKFNYSESYRRIARDNLKVRVQNVIVPDGYNLFVLQKLLVKCH